MNAKKIIFFDGDGTLWYPKATQRREKPQWIYNDSLTKNDYLNHLVLTPKTKDALKLMRSRGLYLVVISANPFPENIAVKEIKDKIDYFDIGDLFYAYRSSKGDKPNDKGRIMLEIIDELGLSKTDALMVGDSYFYDYLAAKKVGIDAYFINNTVSKMPDKKPSDLQAINETWDLIEILRIV